MVYDRDFDVPLPAAQVRVVESGQVVTTADEGNFVLGDVTPGTYTLVFSKGGYTRQVKADVIVSPGQMTEVDAWLTGDFVEMEEFIVQDFILDTSSELGLLQIRDIAPQLVDSVSADLMKQAGVGNAVDALSLVSGTTVQEGKYAVVRGLPDRYVSSQMNGVRLPTADIDKRAVELDQFPSEVIDSIQVSKTFTPDQQGDASGGAVDVVLRGIPDETSLSFSVGTSYNTQTSGANDFLTYSGGGVNCWGKDDRNLSEREITHQPFSFGVERDDASWPYNMSLSGGGRHVFNNGVTVGGFASVFYERDASYIDDGIDDSYWVKDDKLIPQYGGERPPDGDFKTALFDITQGTDQVQWGGLFAAGAGVEDHELSLVYMYTRMAESTATLAEDTRGKAWFARTYYPDAPPYAPSNPDHPAHDSNHRNSAPYLRYETLTYAERTTETLQLKGSHTLPIDAWQNHRWLTFLPPEVDWVLAASSAGLYQPDKRQFGSLWQAPYYYPGRLPWVPPGDVPAQYGPLKEAQNANIGHLQRIWKDIKEASLQGAIDLTFPFEQWSEDEGYVKLGLFSDTVAREYRQESYSVPGSPEPWQEGYAWDQLWSEVYIPPTLEAAEIDVDYDGDQKISAYYAMLDLPVTSFLNIIGGVRWESTELDIVNHPDNNDRLQYYSHDTNQMVQLKPGVADTSFRQNDVLPSIGFVVRPLEQIAFRGAYSETVARQTFKELTPILQQEYLGGDVFIGNPGLRMSALRNYDLRVDYTPHEGGLVSLSWFHKDVEDPIEYVQRVTNFSFTTPVNYPEGELTGFEVEVRQHLGQFWEALDGLSVGANATFIDSEVTLADQDVEILRNAGVTLHTRDMANAPEYLYNLYLTYDLERIGTRVGLFYTVTGDTLLQGAGQAGSSFIPNVYQSEYGTLNLTVSQKLGENWTVSFKAKNLIDPDIETVYRADGLQDRAKTSYSKGREFSLSVGVAF